MRKIQRILVLFVEPMLYNFDLIREVYEKTEYEFRYIYCDVGLTGKDRLSLPENSFVCIGNKVDRKKQVEGQAASFQPDFVVVNGYVGIEQTTLIRYCQKNRVPYAIESDTQLNIPSNKLKAVLKKKYLKRLLHHELCFGFPGGTQQKKNLVYYGIPEQQIYIMPMCVSKNRLTEVYDKTPSTEELKIEMDMSGKFTYLFVGRLEEVKNVQLLIEAYAEYKKMNNSIALLIVGDGSLKAELEKFVFDNQIPDVIFVGYIVFPELIKYYKASDVFVLPSTYEPWGLVVNEAMIMGLPVIVSSEVGCRSDLIEDGQNGFVFESNSKADLFEKMSLINSSQYQNFVSSAKRKTNEWNLAYYLDCFIGAINNANKV